MLRGFFEEHPLLLVIAATICVLAIVRARRAARPPRRTLEQALAETRADLAATQDARPLRAGAGEVPPEFASRLAVRRRSSQVAQGAMMIVVGLSIPLVHSLLATTIAIDPFTPALVWVSALLMGGFIVIGILGIFSRNR